MIRVRCTLTAAAALWLAMVMSPLAAGQSPTPAKGAEATSDTYRDIYQGWKWWHVYCYRCHGVDALGTTNAPNLTDPNEKFTRTEFLRIVKTGKPDTAMQSWSKLLDDKQIGQVYVYVRARADKVLPPGRPDEVGPDKGLWEPPAGWRAR
jgi:mono/diheme cytochrome c family protein